MSTLSNLMMALLVSTALASAVTADTVGRAIIVNEAPGTTYSPCMTDDMREFDFLTMTGQSDCSTKTTYRFNSFILATLEERKQLCSCTLLISQIRTARVPHCTIYKDTIAKRETVSFAWSIQYAFQDCTNSITTVTTIAPTPTLAPINPTPSSSGSPLNNGGSAAKTSSSDRVRAATFAVAVLGVAQLLFML